MTLENLTPWIAIAITLALSILVPLFTQIANNRFQHKKAKQEHRFAKEDEQRKNRTKAYENFLMNVGAAIEYRNGDALRAAGSSIGQIYLYVPKELYEKLDALFRCIRKYDWDSAEVRFFELTKLICAENEKYNHLTKIFIER